jgi:hypothetical protein
VQNGGRLFATAGAGMFDEYNKPNTVMRELLGVELKELLSPPDSRVEFIKQDLPFAKPVATIKWDLPVIKPAPGSSVPDIGSLLFSPQVFGTVSRITAAKGTRVLGTFSDKSPALVQNNTGKGIAISCAFLPSLSYFKPAIPMKPLDRGSTDDAMAHFIPTNFDKATGTLIGSLLADLVRPVVTSEKLVETTVIQAKAGTVITLDNWSGKPVKGLKVMVNIPVPTQHVLLATGGAVKMEKVNDEQVIFTFDLDVADALVLR